MSCGIRYIDRRTGQYCEEKVFAGKALELFYGRTLTHYIFGVPLRTFVSRCPLASRVVGWYQNLPHTKRSIKPFIKTFDIDPSEFEKPTKTFTSFSDFFIRKLKVSSRPIARGDDTAIIPADGRYYFYQDLSKAGPVDIKGRTFSLSQLLENEELAKRYAKGSMVLARLCPSDYHRFHFPISCTPSESKLINGYLYSVNPIAIRRNLAIFWQNKRSLCHLGEVLFLEVGATSVGSIVQTYLAGQPVQKGQEKGYFNFGGSALVILFPENYIQFDEDLVAATRQRIEIRCLMGQSMGKLAITQLA
jgi:phosphatidylserine decarboxylase